MKKTQHEKLDSIMGDISGIKQIQMRHETNLKEHMRRTEMLEQELKPVVKHVAMVKGAGVILTLLGIAAGIYRSI